CLAVTVCAAPTLTDVHTLSLHDALPIWVAVLRVAVLGAVVLRAIVLRVAVLRAAVLGAVVLSVAVLTVVVLSVLGRGRAEGVFRSEEHTSELQSRGNLVCRLRLATKQHP